MGPGVPTPLPDAQGHALVEPQNRAPQSIKIALFWVVGGAHLATLLLPPSCPAQGGRGTLELACLGVASE